MPAKKSQRVRASRRVAIPWSEKLVDPRRARGRRHQHHGLLALVAVAFACGRTVLRQMEDLSADLGRTARRALTLPRKVSRHRAVPAAPAAAARWAAGDGVGDGEGAV